MNCLLAALITSASLVAADPVAARPGAVPANPQDAAAAVYENLATTIINVRATEDSLVQGILIFYHSMAGEALKGAEAGGKDQAKHLEAAAAQVTNIANEGDKRIQAARQRLTKAGHTHHTDAETKEDYIFIDGKEKKQLLALAKKIGQLAALSGSGKAPAADIAAVRKELDQLFAKAIVPE
jgi:hypothetical protein